MCNRMTEERSCINWLYHVPGIGRKTMGKMLSGGLTAEEIYGLPGAQLKSFLGQRCAFTEKQADNIAGELLAYRRVVTPKELAEQLYNKEVFLILPEDPEYPSGLKQIPDAPHILYMKGNKTAATAFSGKSVAIIGSRDCSEYGKYVASVLGNECAHCGLPLVSGMAYGVDGVTQWAAVTEGGTVAAVLGSGVDVCYPPSSRKLYDVLVQKGCIYSEYVPGTEPKPNYFPPRNRIISGIADALIVVEAREKSGTQITVDMALEQGKDVYVVPGRVTDKMSEGCNWMIRQGAVIVCDLQEAIWEIKYGQLSNWKKQDPKVEGINKNPYPLDSIRHAIYLALDMNPESVQQIYESDVWNTGMWQRPPVNTLQAELLYMKFEGAVEEKNGRYCRAK